jgi:hypothetical protein
VYVPTRSNSSSKLARVLASKICEKVIEYVCIGKVLESVSKQTPLRKTTQIYAGSKKQLPNLIKAEEPLIKSYAIMKT